MEDVRRERLIMLAEKTLGISRKQAELRIEAFLLSTVLEKFKNPKPDETLFQIIIDIAMLIPQLGTEANGVETTKGQALNLADVTNSLPDLTLDEADTLAKETDYACCACEDTEEINWGDASAFFIEGYKYAIKKFRQ